MSPKLQRTLPPYMQMAQHYRDRIKSGELKNGDRLPSARQLKAEWGVSHATAAKVLALLRSEGLVSTTQGGAGGTVVNVQEVGYAPRDRMMAVRQWGRIYPPDEHAQIKSAELVAASEQVAEALGLEPGQNVIRRYRVTLRGDTPVSVSTSWFAASLAEVAPDLLQTGRIKQGTAGYIEQQTGRTMKYGSDQFTAGVADADTAADLGIHPGDPVLMGRNWIRDTDGDVIEYGENVSVPGRWRTYEYELG